MGCKACCSPELETSLITNNNNNTNNNKNPIRQVDYLKDPETFEEKLNLIGEYYKGDFKEIEDKFSLNPYNKENKFLPKEEYLEQNKEIIEEKPIKLKNGNIYYGNWNTNCQMEGYGKLYMPGENAFAEGIWKEGLIKYGRVFLENDEIYEGELENSKFNGKGKYISKDNTYEGEFKDGEKTGQCIIIYNDGTKYEGYVENDIFKGKGKIEWGNDIKYEGDFKYGALNGKGKITGLGEKYEGGFENNLFHGEGNYTYENGSYYEGNFFDGIKKGKGTYTVNELYKYEGNWDNDLPYGNGKLTNKDGSGVMIGIWRNGRIYDEPKFIKGSREDFIGIDLNIFPIQKIETRKLNHLKLNNSNCTHYSTNKEVSFLNE